MTDVSSEKGRTALAQLIDAIETRNKWTDTQVAAQAESAGHKLTRSDLSLYRKQGMKQVVGPKLKAVAAGLKLPAYRVAFAVLADLGVEVPEDARTPEAAIHHDPSLSAQARETLLLLIKHDRESE